MSGIVLDARLALAAEMSGETKCFADVCADHGRLAAYLLTCNLERKAIVSDISEPSLAKASALIERIGAADRTKCVVADGLNCLKDSEAVPDTVFILGIGGKTLSGILERGCAFLHGASLILGPHNEASLVRETVVKIGYSICNEDIATVSGQHYVLMKAVPGKTKPMTEKELLLGPVLLRRKPWRWKDVLIHRQESVLDAMNTMEKKANCRQDSRYQLYCRELMYIQSVLCDFGEVQK